MLNNQFSHTQTALKTVAVVVPMSARTHVTRDEEISLRHLTHFLGQYDKYLVVPTGLNLNYTGFQTRVFDNCFFGSAAAYSRLMLSPRFYRSFSDYEYILIYHLDALVFSDQLMEWCRTGLDYIGAPWIKTQEAPYYGKAKFEGKVGNGGFSLRRVTSFLKVIESKKYAQAPEDYWKRFYASKPRLVRYLNLPKKLLKSLSTFNNAHWEISRTAINDDGFFANRATYYDSDFKIAPVETALRFAFECAPRVCFKLNSYRLPFGCHAWHRYDREFWEPFLLRQ